ncbi:uncharacterized protein (TIGR01244 family) [Altererythrobacter atlanticus]|uniref:Beta-lactamase hydrolase-like protein n=1 Tax=Croceibacterium atlanticum TaxID=1267766 RepID=A0A0F7KXE7_9SPHN|nr:TIGR01244 family sulfur transferase [Croceibacterium atlanticum]AKH43465.1 Beta-lactamase hydrolase-like protein [Croceibacterium atlanticum]MBB5731827.1 uncharacterized protein (TIGR01244 family) [Croceibacterium atlanticum]
MSDFRQLSDNFWASPQIGVDQVAEAAKLGFKLIVNNRPEDESADQTPGNAIETAAKEAGLTYIAIPITHAGFSETQVDMMADALANADGPVLAYCRSGTRSTLLWALARAQAGQSPDSIAENTARAGYDVAPVRPAMDFYAAKSRG